MDFGKEKITYLTAGIKTILLNILNESIVIHVNNNVSILLLKMNQC